MNFSLTNQILKSHKTTLLAPQVEAHIAHLPRPLLIKIFSYLPVNDILKCGKTCRYFYSLVTPNDSNYTAPWHNYLSQCPTDSSREKFVEQIELKEMIANAEGHSFKVIEDVDYANCLFATTNRLFYKKKFTNFIFCKIANDIGCFNLNKQNYVNLFTKQLQNIINATENFLIISEPNCLKIANLEKNLLTPLPLEDCFLKKVDTIAPILMSNQLFCTFSDKLKITIWELESLKEITSIQRALKDDCLTRIDFKDNYMLFFSLDENTKECVDISLVDIRDKTEYKISLNVDSSYIDRIKPSSILTNTHAYHIYGDIFLSCKENQIFLQEIKSGNALPSINIREKILAWYVDDSCGACLIVTQNYAQLYDMQTGKLMHDLKENFVPTGQHGHCRLDQGYVIYYSEQLFHVFNVKIGKTSFYKVELVDVPTTLMLRSSLCFISQQKKPNRFISILDLTTGKNLFNTEVIDKARYSDFLWYQNGIVGKILSEEGVAVVRLDFCKN